jgi:hypothetical protein
MCPVEIHQRTPEAALDELPLLTGERWCLRRQLLGVLLHNF